MKITCTCCGNVYYEEGSCPKCGEPLKSNYTDKNTDSINLSEKDIKVSAYYDKRTILCVCMAFFAIFILGNIAVNLVDIISGRATLHSFYTFAGFCLGRNIFLLLQMSILSISILWFKIVNNKKEQLSCFIKINLVSSLILFVLNIIFNYRLYFIISCITSGIATISDVISFYISNILLLSIMIFTIILNIKK